MNTSWLSQLGENRTSQKDHVPEYWTSWFDVDTPANGGDFETVDNIQQIFGDICQKGYQLWSAQCRVAESGLIFDQEVDSNLTDRLETSCTVQGLVCRDNDQRSASSDQRSARSLCQDYSIRFLCQYEGEAVDPSAPSSTPKTSDNSTGHFSEFDVRIYVILALVPVLLFLARLLWVYLCQRYNSKPNPQDPDLEAASSQEDQLSSSTVISELSKLPPSYLDLFGTSDKSRPESSSWPGVENRVLVCDLCTGSACSVTRARDRELELSLWSSAIHHLSNRETRSEDMTMIVSDSINPESKNSGNEEANILPPNVSLSSDRSQTGGTLTGNQASEGNDIELTQMGEINLVCEVTQAVEVIQVLQNPETQASPSDIPPPSPSVTSDPTLLEDSPSSSQLSQTPASGAVVSGSCHCSCHRLLVSDRPDTNQEHPLPTTVTHLKDSFNHKLYPGVRMSVLNPTGQPDLIPPSDFSEPPAYEDALRILKLMGDKAPKSE